MSAVEAAATLSDYIDLWTHRKITPASYGTPPDTADPTQTATVPPGLYYLSLNVLSVFGTV